MIGIASERTRLASIQLAERKAEGGPAPVYMYLFTWESDALGGLFKSAHAMEIPFVFDHADIAPFTGWHLLGTARMGSDPATSVTDRQGRCHEVKNLIVADGSLFPTVAAVNPGSTIGAVALKVADDLARDWA